MSIRDVIGDYKPQVTVEGFDILEGLYKVSVDKLYKDKNRDGIYDRYKMELVIEDTIKGTKAQGRRFFKTYFVDDPESMKKMLNDLFTMDVDLPTGSDESFEGAFTVAIGAKGTVRAQSWTPTKKRDGTEIPEDERVPQQTVKIIKRKATGASKEKLPF